MPLESTMKQKNNHEKAFLIRKKIYEEYHADVAASYNNLGVVYSDLGKYNEAKEYYKKALTIRKKIYEEEHADVATSYNSLGNCLQVPWKVQQSKRIPREGTDHQEKDLRRGMC